MLRLFLIATLMLLPSLLAHGQATGGIGLRRLTTQDGLSDAQVNAFCKDSSGFLWIGTAMGLNRYDGFRFRTFVKEKDVANSLPDNNIMDLFEDSDHRLWVHTNAGYSIFDATTETFDNDIGGWMKAHGMAGTPIMACADRHRHLWIATADGIFHYAPSKGKAMHMAKGTGRGQLPEGNICHIFAVNDDAILSYDDGTLVRVNDSGQLISVSRHIPEHGGAAQSNYRVFIDNENTAYIYNGNGTYIYSNATRGWRYDPLTVRGMSQDRRGRLWVATEHEGLQLYDLDDHKLATISEGGDGAATAGTFGCIYHDDLGVMWVGTYKSGLMYHDSSQTCFSMLPVGDICTILEDADGALWFGSNDAGLLYQSATMRQPLRVGREKSLLGSDIVICSLLATDGSLWFGSYRGGLTRLHGGTFTAYRKGQHGLTSDDIWTLAEGRDGTIYAGTLGNGLQIYHPSSDSFTQLDTSNSSLPTNYISSLFLLDDGRLLIAGSQGFSVLNTRTRQLTNYNATKAGKPFSSTNINQAICDSRGLVWLATTSGLDVYDPHTDQLRSINLHTSQKSNDVCSVAEDSHGIIWTATAGVASKIAVVREEQGDWVFFVESYNESNGLRGHLFNKRAMLTTRRGDIFVGGAEGVNIISPRRQQGSTDNVRVLFSGLLLYDRPVHVGETLNQSTPLKQSLNEGRRLSLSHRDDKVTILLATSSLGITTPAHFIYRLHGNGDHWQYTADGQPSITLADLSPGNYTLEVKAIDSTGRAISQVSSLKISVSPPFLLSWPAMLMYAALVAMAIYAAFLVRKRKQGEQQRMEQLRRKEQLLEKKESLLPQMSTADMTPPNEKLLSKATAIIEKHLNDPDFSVEALAKEMGMSRVNLYRRLMEATHSTPSDMIRDMRLRRAEQLLRRSQLSVSEIAYNMGFSSQRYFSKCFRDFFGCLPTQYRAMNASPEDENATT